MNPGLFGKLPFDPIGDFAPVIMVASVPSMVAVHPSVAAKRSARAGRARQSAAGKVELQLLRQRHAAASGRRDAQARGGNGHGAHSVPRLRAGARRPARRAGAGRREHRGQYLAAREKRQAARDRAALARRYQLAPEVPSVAEFGYRGIDVDQWYAILAPAGTPSDVIATLNREFAKVTADLSVRERMLAASFEPLASTPERIAEIIREDVARWTKIVKELGVKVD